MRFFRYILFMILVFSAISSYSRSLYDESTYEPLVSAVRANEVGDAVTVLIYESTSAQTAAKTDARTDGSVTANAGDGFTDFNAGLGFSNKYNGGGTLNRSGKIMAQVSALVVSVDETGLLEINGEQEISLNSEKQTIKVSGFIRPSDIDDGNIIISYRMAKSKIEIIGKGVLSSAESPGIITRIFQWLF